MRETHPENEGSAADTRKNFQLLIEIVQRLNLGLQAYSSVIHLVHHSVPKIKPIKFKVMKTLANLKEATAIFALCAALTLSITSCQKEELATPNSENSTYDQALPSRTFTGQTNSTELKSQRDRLEIKPFEIAKSRHSKDNAHTGVKPSKISDNRLAKFHQPAIAKVQDSRAPFNEPVQK
jgi:hypothetical protein